MLEKARGIKLLALDFDGVLTDNTVWVSHDGSETVRCWRGDGIGIQKLRKLGVETVILSQEGSGGIRLRAMKLGIQAHLKVDDKLELLNQIVKDKGIKLMEVCYVGNDEPDIPCLEAVGMPCYPHDVQLELPGQRLAHKGGKGAVREVCELIVGAKRAPFELPYSEPDYLR